jgi:hypothetical protein
MAPSDLHQGLIDLLRADPLYALDMIHRAAALPWPVGRVEVRDLGTDLRVPNPLGDDRHLRPDLMFGVYVDGILRAIWIGEVQLHRVPAKPAVIRVYRAMAELHHGVLVHAFVLSPKPHIRGWMQRATARRAEPPVIPEPHDFLPIGAEDVRTRPHACILRAFFHADDLKVLRIAIDATRTLPLHERERYTAILLQFTESPMSENLEAYLRAIAEEPEPDEWDRSRAGWQRAFREGRAEGRSAGLAEGRSAGLAEGRSALVAARVGALLDVLELRGLGLDDATRARIEAETDLATLERWYARAKHVEAFAALFDD